MSGSVDDRQCQMTIRMTRAERDWCKAAARAMDKSLQEWAYDMLILLAKVDNEEANKS